MHAVINDEARRGDVRVSRVRSREFNDVEWGLALLKAEEEESHCIGWLRW